MGSEGKYLQVNWTNGMQVSKDHFIASEDAAIHQIQLARAQGLTPYNYGILPSHSPLESGYELRLVSNKIELIACNAVTPGGIGVQIPAYSGHLVERTVDIETSELSEYAVVLSVKPFERQAVNQVGSESNQIPLAIPTYKLEIRPFGEVPSSHELIVGKLLYNGTEARRDVDYCPPCATAASLDKVLRDLKEYVEKLEKGIGSCLAISKTLKRNESHDPKLAESINEVIENILPRMSDLSDHFRLYLKHAPPVFTLVGVTGIARSLNNVLNSSPKEDNKEQLILNFLSVSGIIDIGEFRASIDELITCEYNHNNLVDALNKMNFFVTLLVDEFLEKLSRMNKYNWKSLDRGRIVIRDKQDHL